MYLVCNKPIKLSHTWMNEEKSQILILSVSSILLSKSQSWAHRKNSDVILKVQSNRVMLHSQVRSSGVSLSWSLHASDTNCQNLDRAALKLESKLSPSARSNLKTQFLWRLKTSITLSSSSSSRSKLVLLSWICPCTLSNINLQSIF